MALPRASIIIFIFPFLMATLSQAEPSFKEIKDVKKLKNAFIDFLSPKVNAVNEDILAKRTRVLGLYETFKKEKAVSLADAEWLRSLAQTHQIDSFDATKAQSFEDLLRRVDIVPVSMALAQAACESDWGRSYFARTGNNLFGHMCMKRGCGMPVSKAHRENSSEGKRFPSVADSVHAYILNLNTHRAYEKVRKTREKLRKSDKKIDGVSLADGLDLYSTQRRRYVNYIKNMIKNEGFEKVEKNSKTG